MKILFYINVLGGGGAERVLSILANGLSDAGHDCVVVTSFPLGAEEYPVNADVRRVNLEAKENTEGFLRKNLRRVSSLRAICQREMPQILVSFMQEPILRALLATRGLPVRNIISVRNDPNTYWKNPAIRAISRLIVPKADWAVFQTDEAVKQFPFCFGEHYCVIPNPVADEFYNATVTHTSKTIVTCGRLAEQKNHALLIDSFASVAEKYPEWKLIIYGEGPLKNSLEMLVSKLGMEDRIALAGRIADVPAALASASAFVLSSDYEGMPNALMEAMAVGLPCISTDCPCGGPRALIDDGVNGLLVRRGDRESLALAISSILGSEQLREKLSQESKSTAMAYRQSNIIGKWEGLLERVYSGGVAK